MEDPSPVDDEEMGDKSDAMSDDDDDGDGDGDEMSEDEYGHTKIVSKKDSYMFFSTPSDLHVVIRSGTTLVDFAEMLLVALRNPALQTDMPISSVCFEHTQRTLWANERLCARFATFWDTHRVMGHLGPVPFVQMFGCDGIDEGTVGGVASVLIAMRVGNVHFRAGSISRNILGVIVSRLTAQQQQQQQQQQLMGHVRFRGLAAACDTVDDDFLYFFNRASSLDLQDTNITDAAITRIAQLCYNKDTTTTTTVNFGTLDVRGCKHLTPRFFYGLEHLLKSDDYTIGVIRMTRRLDTCVVDTDVERRGSMMNLTFSDSATFVALIEYDCDGECLTTSEETRDAHIAWFKHREAAHHILRTVPAAAAAAAVVPLARLYGPGMAPRTGLSSHPLHVGNMRRRGVRGGVVAASSSHPMPAGPAGPAGPSPRHLPWPVHTLAHPPVMTTTTMTTTTTTDEGDSDNDL